MGTEYMSNLDYNIIKFCFKAVEAEERRIKEDGFKGKLSTTKNLTDSFLSEYSGRAERSAVGRKIAYRMDKLRSDYFKKNFR